MSFTGFPGFKISPTIDATRATTENDQNPPTNLNSADQLKNQAVRELIDGTKAPETDELQSKILTLGVDPDEAILEAILEGAAEPLGTGWFSTYSRFCGIDEENETCFLHYGVGE